MKNKYMIKKVKLNNILCRLDLTHVLIVIKG